MKLTFKTIGCAGTVLAVTSCVSAAMASPKPVHAQALMPGTPKMPVPEIINAASPSVSLNKPLTGLKGVWVCVEDISSDAKKDGLDASQIKVEIELRLRRSGITVYDDPLSVENDSVATLDANISTLKTDYGLYGYTLSLNLTEAARLVRTTPCYANATTWTTGYFGIVGADKMAPKLRQAIDDEADEFANDYLAQNPK